LCLLLNVPPPTVPSPLSLHDALPIYRLDDDRAVAAQALHERSRLVGRLQDRRAGSHRHVASQREFPGRGLVAEGLERSRRGPDEDRKSTRLNSSHVKISYAVFCLKKK